MPANLTNLDISDLSNEDVEQLANRIHKYYMSDSATKTQLSWLWERNQLMLDGKQWIIFDGERESGGIWRKLQVSQQNEYIPRPVTNYLLSQYSTLKSYMLKNKPRSIVRANTQDNKDKMAAKIATLICECNWSRLKEQYNYEMAVSNLITYGTVFKKSYWDTSAGNYVKVPRMKSVPITDPMTGMVIGEQDIIDTDPITGEELFDELPIGEVNTGVIDPFRMVLDPLAVNLHEAKWIMEYSIQTIPKVKENFDKEGDGYTGQAQFVEEDKTLNSSMHRWFQLRSSSGLKSGYNPSSEGTSASDLMVENSVVVKEYYEAPSMKYPKGRLVVVAGNKCVYAHDSPYEGPDHGDWHPYSECRWELVPGRFWGKSPLDDGVEIQKSINSIDSVIILTRKTHAVPQKLIPQNIGVAPNTWTGRPGQDIFYRNDGSGAKPEILRGAGPDSSVFAEREQRVNDLKEIMGGADILKGENPPGVTAATALNMLYEVGTGRLYPILDRWKAFIENDQKKQLRCIAKFYKEPRPDFIRALLAKNTDLDEVSINRFIGSDLYDNCNVTVEAGSNIPKLQAAKQALLVELAQLNALGLQSPLNMAQFHEDLGITGYDQETAPDRKRAKWENDLIDNLMNSPDNKPLVLAVDNDLIHLEEHSNRVKSPQFMSLPPEIQRAYMEHIMAHEQAQAQKMQVQMLQQRAMNPQGNQPNQKQSQPAQQHQEAPGQQQKINGGKPANIGNNSTAAVPVDVRRDLFSGNNGLGGLGG